MNKVNFVFYREGSSISKIYFLSAGNIAGHVRFAIKDSFFKNSSSKEETISEYAQDKAGEEGILPVVLNKSKIENRSQQTDKRG